jgi:hypothetical protein
MRVFHVLFHTRPSSGHSTRCHLPDVLVHVTWYGRWLFWCSGVGGVAPHWSYVLPLLTDLAMWGRCAYGALSLDVCQECYTRQDSSPPGRPSHADRNSGIILGSRLTNLTLCLASILFKWLKIVWMQSGNVKEFWILQGLSQDHTSWSLVSHGIEEFLSVVLQFWHPAVW